MPNTIYVTEKCEPGEYEFFKEYRHQVETLKEKEKYLAMLVLQGSMADSIEAIRLPVKLHKVFEAPIGQAFHAIELAYSPNGSDNPQHPIISALSPNGFIKPTEPIFHKGRELVVGYLLEGPEGWHH